MMIFLKSYFIKKKVDFDKAEDKKQAKLPNRPRFNGIHCLENKKMLCNDQTTVGMATVNPLSDSDILCRLMINVAHIFGPRPGSKKTSDRSEIKLFDTLILFLKELFENLHLKKADDKKHTQLYSMQRLS